MSAKDSSTDTATTTNAALPKGKCAVCGEEATKRCSRCKTTWYCTAEHQKQDWKIHKKTVCNDTVQADQYTLHKREFDRIIQKYALDTDAKSTEIAEFLTAAGDQEKGGAVSAATFAEKFGTTPEEAVVFLEWINVGVKFKQQSIDIAKQSGFAAPGGGR